MNQSRRILLPATIALLLLAGAWWSAHLATRYRRQLEAQPAAAAQWAQHLQQSREQRDALLRKLEAAQRQQTSASAQTALPAASLDVAEATEVDRWVQQVKRLKQAFAQRPDQKIPELAVLYDRLWLNLVRRVKLDTEDDQQRAFAIVRNEAKSMLTQWMLNAMRRYVKENGGRLPADPAELGRYFNPTLDPAIFAQYEMVRSGRLNDAPKGPVLREKAVVNEDYDSLMRIERDANASLTYNYDRKHDPAAPPDERQLNDEFKNDAENAVRAFAAANHGAMPASPAQLLPYFDPPLGPMMTEKFTRPLSAEEQKKFQDEIAPLWHR